jgi:hypothetical protein
MSEVEKRQMRCFVALVLEAVRAVKHAHSELPAAKLPEEARDALYELRAEVDRLNRSTEL